jgi:choice-of-anchor B domain-containing protein
MNTRKLVVVFMLLFAASLAVWSARAHEGEHQSPGGNGQPGNVPLAAMSNTPCVGGFAGTFPCNKVDLAALLPLADIDGATVAVNANDIWGWTDPLTDKEYALLGLSNGVAFVDVTSPSAPVYLGNLPTHADDGGRLWRSLKVYRNHLFVVSEITNHGMQVFDLTQLRGVAAPPQTFSETAHYNNFSRAHTIAVNEETGYAYVAGSRPGAGRTPGVDTCSDSVTDSTGKLIGRGLHMVDIRNPAAPAFAGCVDQDGYTHETQCVVYRGPDTQHQGREICFSANEDTLTIVDVTNKAAPAQLSRTPYVGRGYTHQGWLTGDHARFLLDDELDEQQQALSKNRTFVWDVSDLDAPFVRGIFQGSTGSIDHNLYVRGLFAFESNYRSGVRVVDASGADAANLSEVAFFDVYPVDDAALFNGTWGNYPFFASGTVVASGMEQGLFVLRPQVGLPVRIDYEPFFVRQQYRDFLNREPDEPGLGFWTHEIEQCMADAQCREVKRINVSAAFFLSIESQDTGYLVYRMHRSSFGTQPAFAGFTSDARQVGQNVVVGQSGWEQQLAANKSAFAEAWVQRPAFLAEFPAGMDAQAYVTKLFQRAGVSPTAAEVQAAVNAYGSGNTQGRALALLAVVEGATITQAHKSPAFVLMEYFGYLRRDPDVEGYNHWLDKLNSFNGNYVEAEMVKAFISSIEYRQRFGQ